MNPIANQIEAEILRRLNQTKVLYEIFMKQAIKVTKESPTLKDQQDVYLFILKDSTEDFKLGYSLLSLFTWKSLSRLIRDAAAISNYYSNEDTLLRILRISNLEEWQKEIVREYFDAKLKA